ncbi:MAG: SPOR domain-containing protein [Calditrichaeota bacterium]|nr:MAG: SPOR domain-containing protein [Calditrichota bacterium]
MIRFTLFLGLLLILASCGGSRATQTGHTATDAKKKYDESFDPRTLNDDDIVIARTVNASGDKTETAEKKENTAENTSFREVNGFRVQIFVTKDFERATLVREEAREMFKDAGYATYLVFESNMYKVRIGDAQTREDAEKIREQARDHNYREAFIVRSKIRVPATP